MMKAHGMEVRLKVDTLPLLKLDGRKVAKDRSPSPSRHQIWELKRGNCFDRWVNYVEIADGKYKDLAAEDLVCIEVSLCGARAKGGGDKQEERIIVSTMKGQFTSERGRPLPFPHRIRGYVSAIPLLTTPTPKKNCPACVRQYEGTVKNRLLGVVLMPRVQPAGSVDGSVFFNGDIQQGRQQVLETFGKIVADAVESRLKPFDAPKGIGPPEGGEKAVSDTPCCPNRKIEGAFRTICSTNKDLSREMGWFHSLA